MLKSTFDLMLIGRSASCRAARVLFYILLAAAPAGLAETVGTGLLLFNYSNLTAYVGESTNPGCVNNQGSIPEPMTTGPGTLSQATGANQDIEFTKGGSCDIWSGGNDEALWRYPFSLYFSDGQPGTIYTFGNTPGPISGGACSSTAGGFNIVGIYGIPCGFFWGTDDWSDDSINAWYTNAPLVVFPSSETVYYVMTALSGPSSGVTGNACSAPNWWGCALIQVYNNGEGPYAGGASPSVSAFARVLNASAKASTAVALPALARPAVMAGRLKAGSTRIVLRIKAGGASRSLRRQYGVAQLGNALDVLVVGQDSLGGQYRVTSQTNLRSDAPLRKWRITLSLTSTDAAALKAVRAQGGRIRFEVQVQQHVATPRETFELPAHGRFRVKGH
jgi:hypothetical protein